MNGRGETTAVDRWCIFDHENLRLTSPPPLPECEALSKDYLNRHCPLVRPCQGFMLMRVVGIAGPSIFMMESDRYISVLTSSWTALERP